MQLHRAASVWLALLAGATVATNASAAPLNDPPPFASAGGELNLILTATAAPVDFNGVQTTGWVYKACARASATATTCLPGTEQSPYGGVRLGLQRNDTLHLRLVNALPPVPDAKHCPDNPDLANNPTNLHTHGLIVEPHRATSPGDPYGDYVFVELRNPHNSSGCAPAAPGAAAAHRKSPVHAVHEHAGGAGGGHPDMDVADAALEYAIHLIDHPPGLFWFHPHMHGVALNQVTAGLAGVITVGTPADECGRDASCRTAVQASTERVLILKDSEVLADGTLLNQQDPGFCPGTAAAGEPPRQGNCQGDAAAGFGGGHWFHTINGQTYPDIAVGREGDLWRLVNAAGSRSYDLSVMPDGGTEALPLQVLSIDGITIDAPQGMDLRALQEQFGGKVDLFRCPGSAARQHGEAVCTRHVRMMPSARVAVRVLNDKDVAQHAVLRTADFRTGPDADDWPAIDLASVNLASPATGVAPTLALQGDVRATLGPTGILGRAPLLLAPGAARPQPLADVQRRAAIGQTGPAPTPQTTLRQAELFAIDQQLKLGLRQDSVCANLEPGEHRRIYFGNPTPGQDGFGLATVVIDANGHEKPNTATAMRVFDPTQTTICLTAAPASARYPTTETWEILNLTAEDHNFHIHQTRFWLLSKGPTQPGRIEDVAVLQDNVPLAHAADVSGCDGSVAKFKDGSCKPQAVILRIPFTQIGDFVFHCHILEHEDGGMMARIRVVAPPYQAARR